MKRFGFWLSTFIFLLSCNQSTQNHSAIQQLSLLALDGKWFPLQQTEKNKATIFLFIQPECPFCKSYAKTFRTIDSIYSAQQIPVLGIVAGRNYPVEDIKSYRDENNFHFNFLLDPEFSLTKVIGARVTPEVFLIDAKGTVLYQGLIDDWAYEIGKVKSEVTQHYLMNATDAFLHGEKINLDSTVAVGCYIQ